MPINSPSFATTLSSISGIRVTELAHQFGTPCYVYDGAKIVERIGDLAAFDVVRYAQKACSNLAIVDLVRRHHALVDTVSAGEIRRAMAAGFVPGGEPPSIAYTADIFDRESLELVLQHGIHVNCGSPDMIDQLGQRAPDQDITLRINPGFGHGHSQKTNTGGEQSKHGIWHEQLPECLERASRHGLTVSGLHMHIGSGTDLEHLSQVGSAMERAARIVDRSVQTISAGGGLPVPYQTGEAFVDIGAYFRIWDATRKRLEDAYGHPVRLEIEPGRFVVAESGYLVTEIRAIKSMGINTFYLVDAGFNNLARPVLYGAYHPMAIVSDNGASGKLASDDDTDKAGGPPPPLHPVVVGGPLCESGDIFTQQSGGVVAPRHLPPAKVGDLLVILCAGAYGFVMSSNYCSKPMCAEVLLEGQQAHLIRSRQGFEDLVRGELIPEID